MTMQTQQLDAALDRLDAWLRHDVAGVTAGPPGDAGAVLAAHAAGLERCLRQLRGLDDQLDRLGTDADALPPDERSRAHARLDALEADLDRVRRKAARAAFRIAGRGDGLRAAGPDGRIEAVHALLRGLGESVEPGDVRAAVTATLRNAMYRSASGAAAAGLDGAALARHAFAVVALAIVLARQGRPGAATL